MENFTKPGTGTAIGVVDFLYTSAAIAYFYKQNSCINDRLDKVVSDVKHLNNEHSSSSEQNVTEAITDLYDRIESLENSMREIGRAHV